jgi:glycosyltransferase involved in cell wall biosynthesis
MRNLFLYMQKTGLVSIIIPVYKTGSILMETIQSVLQQTYQQFEIIAIDDGSGDTTIDELGKISDSRIKIIRQENQGMAQTRNNGLLVAQGEFILFLDHDDIIEPDFLAARIDCLAQHPEAGFVGGPIRTFPGKQEDFLSVAVHVEEETLFFDPRFLTTPSGYLIRNKILSDNGIIFNTMLSSTADRFLLLQLGRVTRGVRVDKGRLLYRVSPGGYSQTIRPALIFDNEELYKQMKKNRLMPKKNIQKFKSLYFFMLAGGFKRIGYWHKTIFYLLLSFFSSPVAFFKRVKSRQG